MPTLFFPLTVVTQVFEDETALGEILNFGEISRFDADDDRRRLALRANAEEILKRAAPLELAARVAPVEIEQTSLAVKIEPPRSREFWRVAVEIKFDVLHLQREDGYLQAFVPALGIAVLSRRAEEFAQQIENEIRAALLRLRRANSLRELRWLERIRETRIEPGEIAVEWKTIKQRQVDEEKKTEEKSILEQVGTRLNDEDLAPAYEVEQSVQLFAETLSAGKHRKSVLLVGASGAGKTVVVHELVRTREKFGLAEISFWTTGGARLVAGQSGFGQWQERCQNLIAEAKKTNAILHLGNLFELLEVGKSAHNAQGIADFFRPKIARGEIQTILECTPEQLPVIERRAPHLLAAFHQLRIDEPDAATGLKILRSIAAEKAGGAAAITDEAVKTIDSIHRRYATYSAFPGRPVRFLRNLLSNAGFQPAVAGASRARADGKMPSEQPAGGWRYESEQPAGSRHYEKADVFRAFAEETGLPLFLLSDAEKLDLSETERWFAGKVLGQPEAVRLIVDLIATVKAKLTRRGKPVASLLFIGATGVGKTELTKALAEFFFADKNRMTRFDMSEFSTALAVQRLVGGAGDAEGQLTAKMREQPFSVLLFDEFEKADPAFFDLLLQILGEGRLTDAAGRTADFSNAIIVMTSNLGAENFARGKSGFLCDRRQRETAVNHFTVAVREFLRPEIYNRIDRIVPFAPLDEKTAEQITRLELEKLILRDGLRFRTVKLNIAPPVFNFLANVGYDSRYGARPLRRAIERELLAPLAAELNQRSPAEKLTISVGLSGGKSDESAEGRTAALSFAVESDASQKKRGTTDFVLAAQAARAADLRRKTQKLAASSHLIELEDERFQLARLKERAARGRWVSPEDLARLDKLPKIQNFLETVKTHGETAAALEDSILLEIYGKEGAADPRFAAELTATESALQRILLDLLRLKFEKPDEICLAIFSENAQALFRLARSYFYCAEEFKSDANQIFVFTSVRQKDENPLERPLFGREVWRQEIKDAEKFFAKTTKETVGVLLKIAGVLANPRFAAESGVHSFAAGSQTDKVLVIPGDFNLPKCEPTEKLALRNSIDAQTKRRYYDANTKTIQDFRLGKNFEFDGRVIAEACALAIEEHLQQTAAKLIE